MNILADASLPVLDLAFPPPFVLQRYANLDELTNFLPTQDVLLCRSTLQVNSALLKNNSLRYVATASSGTDHVDHAFLKTQGIGILDAKGSNASSVADYVVSCLAYLDQHHLIKGKKAGVIGMGKVGTQVYDRLKTIGFQMKAYDPLKSKFHSCSLNELYEADLLCIHAELHRQPLHPSFNLIDHQFLQQLKPDAVIINAARGGVVNEQALLDNQIPLTYCTDVYLNEPKISKAIIDKATLCTPHIAGHSIEAKIRAVLQLSQQLHNLLELPLPVFPQPEKQKITESSGKSWQDLVLRLYNPAEETRLLKQAGDKESAFLTLRKHHQKRHDFSLYAASVEDKCMLSLLGL